MQSLETSYLWEFKGRVLRERYSRSIHVKLFAMLKLNKNVIELYNIYLIFPFLTAPAYERVVRSIKRIVMQFASSNPQKCFFFKYDLFVLR